MDSKPIYQTLMFGISHKIENVKEFNMVSSFKNVGNSVLRKFLRREGHSKGLK